jgi:DNA-binding transcriptional MocR family regulator
VTEKRERVLEHVRGLIARGALRRGSRVPSILELTRALGVGKNTVIGALDELAAQGVIEARPRQGFFVRSARRTERARPTRLSDLQADKVGHGMATILVRDERPLGPGAGPGGSARPGGARGAGAGVTGAAAAGEDQDLVAVGSGTTSERVLATPEWTSMLRSYPPRDPHTALRYADPSGEPGLREVLAARGGGAEVAPENVIVTCGAVEALNLSFLVTSEERGSRRIGIEAPGYFLLEPMVEALGLEPVHIPRSARGLDLDALRAEIRRAPLAAMMINPNHHNPIGGSLPMDQRFELARLADDRARGFWIVEDDLYKGLWMDHEEPPSVHSLLPARTLYVSSFSKTLGPALRVGFICAPPQLRDALRRRKFLHTLSGDAYTQNIVADFIDRSGYQRHLAQVRDELARRARAALHQASPFASLGGFVARHEGGLFWRFEFRPDIDTMRLYAAARERHVLLSPGSFFVSAALAAEHQSWMRVNVSRCEGTTLSRVLGLLRELAARAA